MRATGSGGAKTIYSPIKRQTQQQAQHPVIDGDATINDSSSSFELDYNTQQQQQQQTRQQPYHDYNHYQNQPVESREFEIGQTPVEEVYIYNCCGLTSELNPSIKFMSAYRCIFFLFNFLVFAFGLANFGMGLWFRIDPKVYEIHKYIETQNFTYAGWIILVGGFLACLMSLIGFVATSRQLISLSVLYISILILLTIAFVGALVLMIVYGLGDTLEQFMVKEIYEQMRRRSMNMELDAMMTNEAAQFIDFVQVKMRCCGATDFRDYMKLGMTIPTTCHTIDRNFINAHGCGHAIRELMDLRAGLATGFALGSVIVQLVAIVASTLIVCSIYHWRANPKQQIIVRGSPTSRSATPNHRGLSSSTSVINQRNQSPATSMYNLQRPRSRTPIII